MDKNQARQNAAVARKIYSPLFQMGESVGPKAISA
jgi:hypothetical protein